MRTSRAGLLAALVLAAPVAVALQGHHETTTGPGSRETPSVARVDGPADEWSLATVRVESGVVRGRRLDDGGVGMFAGIPFAAPPVGPLRWRAPVAPPPWPDVREATAFGPACTQVVLTGSLASLNTVGPGSEDCLTLNVWTPARRPAERLPVMVWIFGGGFLFGSASQEVYDGAWLARRGVVVVTFNYRLGPFGFLAHPALSRESGVGASGNYGLLDQVAALAWVRRNIAAFGGDADRVTVFGESAGAASINTLMVSPLARGLFHRAILESGTMLGRIQHLTEGWYFQPSGEEIGRRVASAIGVDAGDPLKALRAASPEAVVAAARPQLPFSGTGHLFAPIVDGHVVPDDPAQMMSRGQFARVPVIVGANADEGTVFADQLAGQMPLFTYRQLLAFAYSGHTREVSDAFPASTDDEARTAIARSLGMAAFVAPARRLARDVSSSGGRAFLYHFSKTRPGTMGERYGAFHGSEVPFVFGALRPRDMPGLGTLGIDDRDRALSVEMAGAWIRFAATGDPNGPGIPTWPAYDSERRAVMEFGPTASRARPDPCAGICDLFDAVARDWQARKVTAMK